MNQKQVYLILFSVLLLQACGGGKDKKNSAGDKNKGPVVLDAAVASLQNYSNFIEANGNIITGEYVELRPETAGRVVYLNIPEGKNVAEGTLLLKLYDDDLKAQLKKFRSQLDIAVKTEERLRTLLSVNGLNRQEYDLALNQVRNIEADIELTEAQIRKTELRAPFSGTIGLRRISRGAFVSTQDVIASMQQTSVLKLDFVLPVSQGKDLNTGDEVSVISDGNATYTAKIIGIEPMVNLGTRNIQFRAIFTGTNFNTLRPGAFVKVRIDAAKNKKGIMVPTNSIIPETRFKKMAVIKNGLVEMVNVETGYRSENSVEIISGLNEGDTFAVSSILYLKPGSEVKIKSIKQY